jgi:peroxiredoxin
MQKYNKISKLRRKYPWLTILLDSLLIIAVFFTISWYQNRGTLAADGKVAPDFKLQNLKGDFVELSSMKGKKVLVYFFAPWCRICSLSSGNLNNLRASRDIEELEILIIGLSWESVDELIKFAEKQGFTSPVLIGTSKQLEDYKIKGFPTYFVIDEDGRVIHRSVGYSTEIGLRVRT